MALSRAVRSGARLPALRGRTIEAGLSPQARSGSEALPFFDRQWCSGGAAEQSQAQSALICRLHELHVYVESPPIAGEISGTPWLLWFG